MQLLNGLSWRWQYLKRRRRRSPESGVLRRQVGRQLDQMTDAQLSAAERTARRLLVEQTREDLKALIWGRSPEEKSS